MMLDYNSGHKIFVFLDLGPLITVAGINSSYNLISVKMTLILSDLTFLDVHEMVLFRSIAKL